MSVNPYEPLDLGNTKDDDGQVIDSFFVETDNPPEPVTDIQVIPTTVRPKPTNRLLTTGMMVQPLWDGTQLMPADANRKSLIIRTAPGANTDFVRVADESGKIGNDTGAGRLYAGGQLALDDYTGPVYVSASGSANPVYVSVWSITS